MKALILNDVVVDVALEEFAVAEPLFWVDCPENCVSYFWGYANNSVYQIPEPQINVVIPQSVTRREMKLALLSEGLLDDVELVISDSGDRALQINWQEALDFKRDNPLVLGMAATLKKTDEDIDNLFLKAKSFE